jgi:transposase
VAGAEEAPRGLVAERSDATLAEYVAAFRARTGRSLSRSAMCRTLGRLDLPRKKRRLYTLQTCRR